MAQIKHRGYTDPYAWEQQPLSPEVKAALREVAPTKKLYVRTEPAEEQLKEWEEALLFAKHCIWYATKCLFWAVVIALIVIGCLAL